MAGLKAETRSAEVRIRGESNRARKPRHTAEARSVFLSSRARRRSWTKVSAGVLAVFSCLCVRLRTTPLSPRQPWERSSHCSRETRPPFSTFSVRVCPDETAVFSVLSTPLALPNRHLTRVRLACLSAVSPCVLLPAACVASDCAPTPPQAALHGEVAALLARAAEAIALIAAYEDKGCAAHIQKALNTPSPESEEAAFQAVAACVVSIQKFYQVRARSANGEREVWDHSQACLMLADAMFSDVCRLSTRGLWSTYLVSAASDAWSSCRFN
jgi:hypothetical protein